MERVRFLDKDLKQLFEDRETFSVAQNIDGIVFRKYENRVTKKFEIQDSSYFIKYHGSVGWKEIFKNILGNEGYSFAEVRGVPDINESSGEVDLTFYVDPQQRTYVRRIVFKGNKRTHDVVLRREMRQMEGAWASNNLIENSKLNCACFAVLGL